MIGKWLETPANDPKTNKPVCRERCTVPEVAEKALQIEAGRLGTADQRRITSALTSLGWGQKRDNKGRWWQPVTAVTASDAISL